MQLNHEAYRIEERIDELAQQKERAERYLQAIRNNSTGNQRQLLGLVSSPLGNAQAEANRIQRELEKLQRSLKELQE
jgi:prefoldin subunit 5